MLIKEKTKIFLFLYVVDGTLENVPDFETCGVKAEFCAENFGGRDTSFTLKGLKIKARMTLATFIITGAYVHQFHLHARATF